MSTSHYIVKPGDVLLVPVASSNTLAQLNVVWQQNLSDKQASYHTGLVQVKEKPGEQVLFFVESEWYTDSASAPSSHISKVAPKVGEFYELTVNDKVRYGQKNAQGENRFIVYHDTSRNPYQHRFVTPALRIAAMGLGNKIAARMGASEELIKSGLDQFAAIFGDPLRKF